MESVVIKDGNQLQVNVAPQKLAVVVGIPGPPGESKVNVSPDVDNQIEKRPNGLYVKPLQYKLNDW